MLVAVLGSLARPRTRMSDPPGQPPQSMHHGLPWQTCIVSFTQPGGSQEPATASQLPVETMEDRQ